MRAAPPPAARATPRSRQRTKERVVEDADPYGAVAVTRGKRSSRVRAGGGTVSDCPMPSRKLRAAGAARKGGTPGEGSPFNPLLRF